MKKTKYLKYFPKPFLKDLVENRCLPILGAGFSKNADIPLGKKMLDWDELGRSIAEDIDDYDYTTAIDAISSYSEQFSRVNLVEKLGELLLVDTVKAGKTHKAFCELPFDVVCTTNFEFLLEQGYNLISKYCRPITDEDQLSLQNTKDGVTLLKMHGDLHHPNRLIVTEDDYDGFLSRNPMLATYLANLLITRTALFIGYSLDDTNFRQILALIKERLGKLKRQAYVIKVNCSLVEKAKYERRGVRVISIDGNAKDYPSILSDVFTELREYWQKGSLDSTLASEEAAQAEILLPEDSHNRLCFFSVPFKLISFYNEHIFPLVVELGLVPASADEFISLGDNWMAKIAALIDKAEFVVIDITSQNTIFELGLALSQHKSPNRVLIITDESSPLPNDLAGQLMIRRPDNPYQAIEELRSKIKGWFTKHLVDLNLTYGEEPRRLLNKKEYRAAIISAITLLEVLIRRRLENESNFSPKSLSLQQLFHLVMNKDLFINLNNNDLQEWIRTRNELVHTSKNATSKEAKEIVAGVYRIIETNQLQ